MLRGFFGNLIFAIIARILRRNHLDFHITHATFSTLSMDIAKMIMRNGEWGIEMEN